MNSPRFVPDPSFALLTDLYPLMMVYGYWKAGMAQRQAVFQLHFRKPPFRGGYAVAAGLETAIRLIQSLQFKSCDLAYLETLCDSQGKRMFEKAFLQFLSRFSFSCDIDAIEEGSLVFPYEPLIRVKGPIWQAQLLKSPLLNLINFQSLIASRAARVCLAASPDPVIEFGMRKGQGIDNAISASRAAYIGGCSATSDAIAGQLLDIPVRATHASSFVMAFDEEKMAFETFAKIMPSDCVMLVDTYDSILGVKNAIDAVRSIKNFDLSAVRIDSCDLRHLSLEIRKILDEASFYKTQIMAGADLDETQIRDLKQQGAKIDIWGVGIPKDPLTMDGVYQLSAVQDEKGKWQDRLKISEPLAKSTNPGLLQIRRFFDGHFYSGDVIFDEMTGVSDDCTAIQQFNVNNQIQLTGEHENLLKPIMRQGKVIYSFQKLTGIQSRARIELQRLPPATEKGSPYFYGLEKTLYQKKIRLIQKLRNRSVINAAANA